MNTILRLINKFLYKTHRSTVRFINSYSKMTSLQIVKFITLTLKVITYTFLVVSLILLYLFQIDFSDYVRFIRENILIYFVMIHTSMLWLSEYFKSCYDSMSKALKTIISGKESVKDVASDAVQRGKVVTSSNSRPPVNPNSGSKLPNLEAMGRPGYIKDEPFKFEWPFKSKPEIVAEPPKITTLDWIKDHPIVAIAGIVIVSVGVGYGISYITPDSYQGVREGVLGLVGGISHLLWGDKNSSPVKFERNENGETSVKGRWSWNKPTATPTDDSPITMHDTRSTGSSESEMNHFFRSGDETQRDGSVTPRPRSVDGHTTPVKDRDSLVSLVMLGQTNAADLESKIKDLEAAGDTSTRIIDLRDQLHKCNVQVDTLQDTLKSLPRTRSDEEIAWGSQADALAAAKSAANSASSGANTPPAIERPTTPLFVEGASKDGSTFSILSNSPEQRAANQNRLNNLLDDELKRTEEDRLNPQPRIHLITGEILSVAPVASTVNSPVVSAVNSPVTTQLSVLNDGFNDNVKKLGKLENQHNIALDSGDTHEINRLEGEVQKIYANSFELETKFKELNLSPTKSEENMRWFDVIKKKLFGSTFSSTLDNVDSSTPVDTEPHSHETTSLLSDSTQTSDVSQVNPTSVETADTSSDTLVDEGAEEDGNGSENGAGSDSGSDEEQITVNPTPKSTEPFRHRPATDLFQV